MVLFEYESLLIKGIETSSCMQAKLSEQERRNLAISARQMEGPS